MNSFGSQTLDLGETQAGDQLPLRCLPNQLSAFIYALA